MEDFFQVGVITSTHGLQGEVKVYPTTDDSKRFRRLKEVILSKGEVVGRQDSFRAPWQEGTVLKIERVKYFKQFVILKFEGVDSIEEADKYRRASLLVSRDNAVRLAKDEYFIADLIGLAALDEEGNKIGVVKDVLQTGANDVYVISMNTGKELLLPAIRQCVLEVDVEAGYIRVHVLEGLEEL